ncbi:putative glycoside hydrolase family 2 protein [Rosellinia necatrix]|uniref:Putative glycoside hydrolase family 2 protein n=1 Tax=Rosellinia necatrix TaxID=77044 RepID=A0A1W2TPU0_ROSNE|nr:putative glycoside hydrolase family 2 protein [Rosellinia necatrix]
MLAGRIRDNAFRFFGLCCPVLNYLPVSTARAIDGDHGSALASPAGGRQVTKLDTDWRFWHSFENPDGITYDQLKAYILPCGNDFIANPGDRHQPPPSGPNITVQYAGKEFNDSNWEIVKVPHDWAIKGPFYVGDNVPVKGGMGRLPVQGIGWYRRTIALDSGDTEKEIYLDIDGAMSYATVWLNGKLVGGWPYGYNSFRLDLTPYLVVGVDNQLAIRLDNPTESSRWYPGGGLYRNVWLTKVDKTHIGQSGTFITTEAVSSSSATLNLAVLVQNKADVTRNIDIYTEVFKFNPETGEMGSKVADFPRTSVSVSSDDSVDSNSSTTVQNPQLWGVWTSQKPNMYIAVTKLFDGRTGKVIDTYPTRFGIRKFFLDPNKGLLVNGSPVRIQGVNQHHDLGALGAAFNVRAAERQLEILQDMGVNAVRMSHNPPAPELLDLLDRKGFLVMDEIFDSWEIQKNPNDFHLIFSDWHEADLRSFMRRDRNHPSIYLWSVGNEVGEQYTEANGTAVARGLVDIAHQEDPSRPVTTSMNYAKPNMTFPSVFDVISLNYQGEGIRDVPAYSQLSGIVTPPLYSGFKEAFPDVLIESSETASALSSRGTYIFPVTSVNSAPVNDTSGGNSTAMQVSAFELYSADFGSSAEKVFGALDQHPFVAGEFVWSGFDYIGEPTPYYSARSSYSGIIDLAGFPKDRYYLYQSHWRPELRTAHILPHWTWPDRQAKVTPVHVFSSADEAELFLNGKSQGRLVREQHTYRFRWDEVIYVPGELHVVTYKNGQVWANATVETVGHAAGLRIKADQSSIRTNSEDLAYITVEVIDSKGRVVPQATNDITFDVSGAGELVATDNGDPTDFTAFPSKQRKTYSGLALGIVRSRTNKRGPITVVVSGVGLKPARVAINAI